MNLFRCFAISFALSSAAACSSGPGTGFQSRLARRDALRRDPCGRLADLYRDPPRYARAAASAIGLHFADGTVLGRGAKVTDARRETVERVVEAPFYRQARFTET